MSAICRAKKLQFVGLVAVVLCFTPFLAVSQSGSRVQKLADIEFDAIAEMSGLAVSRRYEDVIWMHNDSGDEPRLFATNFQGRVIMPSFLRNFYHGEEAESGKQPWPGLSIATAANIDWEDIAVDDDFIYIADMGNNGNARRDLGVYLLAEPNPRSRPIARPFKFIPVRYPEQESYPPSPPANWQFDSEAVFVQQGRLYFLTKHRGLSINEPAAGTHLYRLDTTDSDRINDLTRIDSFDDAFFITAAELSPDGLQLAAVGYTELWLFENPLGVDGWLSGQARRLELDIDFTGFIESLTWLESDSLLIGNEDEEWFTVKVSDLSLHDDVSRTEQGLREFRDYVIRRR